MRCRTKFVAVGDISLGDFPLTLGFGVRSTFENNKVSFFNNDVMRVFKSADLCFGNLETVISDINYNPRNLVSAQMRGGSGMAELLADSGINLLSVANNHMMQHGPAAFIDTVNLLNSVNISPVGIANVSGRTIVNFHDVNGYIFCTLGYSMRPEKYCKPALYAIGSKEIILSDIEQNKNNCDCLILSLHWGDEFVDFPSPTQVLTAHDFINAGAKIIIGHHPHIVQGVEKYNGGVIAYSLGNFVFDIWQKRLRESMILVVNLSGADVDDISIVPVIINKNYAPELLTGNDASNLSKKIKKLCNHPVLTQNLSDEKFARRYMDRYDFQVRLRLIENKIQNRIFFLRHLYKYPDGIVSQSLGEFVAGRVSQHNENVDD